MVVTGSQEALTQRGLQSSRSILGEHLRVSFVISVCCENSRDSAQREVRVCSTNLGTQENLHCKAKQIESKGRGAKWYQPLHERKHKENQSE